MPRLLLTSYNFVFRLNRYFYQQLNLCIHLQTETYINFSIYFLVFFQFFLTFFST